MTTAVERKYKMTRVRAGSYLLPSNDGETLWHIYSFEDGESHGLEGEPDRTWWAAAKFRGTFEEASAAVMRDLLDFDYITHERWSEWASYMKTRGEAIEAALGAQNTDTRTES